MGTYHLVSIVAYGISWLRPAKSPIPYSYKAPHFLSMMSYRLSTALHSESVKKISREHREEREHAGQVFGLLFIR